MIVWIAYAYLSTSKAELQHTRTIRISSVKTTANMTTEPCTRCKCVGLSGDPPPRQSEKVARNVSNVYCEAIAEFSDGMFQLTENTVRSAAIPCTMAANTRIVSVRSPSSSHVLALC